MICISKMPIPRGVGLLFGGWVDAETLSRGHTRFKHWENLKFFLLENTNHW